MPSTESKTASPAFTKLNDGDAVLMNGIIAAIVQLADPTATVFTFEAYIKAIKVLVARIHTEHKRTLLTGRYGKKLGEIKAMTAPNSRPSLFQFRHGVLMVERLWVLGLIQQDAIEGIVGADEYKLMMP